MKKLVSSLLAAVLLVGTFAGCSDAPTATPSATAQLSAPVAPDNALLGLLALTPVLKRRAAIAQDITVKARIGIDGGTIAIPEAGLRVVVPRGAVSSPVDFEATALAGYGVAYKFAPHGIRFAKPLQVTQDLRGTEWLGLPLLNMRAGYFKDDSQLQVDNLLVKLDELLPLSVDLLRVQASFNIDHFSGYVISTGRSAQ